MVWTPDTPYPLPPRNLIVTSAYTKWALDIRWEDPSLIGGNSPWNILGVNLYRSEASDRGPFVRVNQFPIGSGFFRDRTNVVRVDREVIPWEGWHSRGDSPNSRRWSLKTRFPVSKPVGSMGSPVDPEDVFVEVDGRKVEVHEVHPSDGVVVLANVPYYDHVTDRHVFLSISEETQVCITYFTTRSIVSPGVDRKSFYRATSVAMDLSNPGSLLETPLDVCKPASDMEVEQIDYMWAEAIRRNNWILEQGGERVHLFVAKVAGVPCRCALVPSSTLDYGGQPSSLCTVCYGVGWVGGYEGPYDVIIAPDDGEKSVSQGPGGRSKNHSYETWLGPTPVVSQRDFFVKQNNERFVTGPVRRPTNRGNVMQQHFQIQYLDSTDIRYTVPLDGTESLLWPQTRYTYQPNRETYDARTDAPWPAVADQVLPMATRSENDPPVSEPRGRTPAWHNLYKT